MLEAHMSNTMFHFRMVATSFNFIDDSKSETFQCEFFIKVARYIKHYHFCSLMICFICRKMKIFCKIVKVISSLENFIKLIDIAIQNKMCMSVTLQCNREVF